MPATYEPIATTTLTTASTNTITFSNIPQTYTDLRLVQIAMQTTSHNDTRARVNGQTTTYGIARMNRDGTAVAATNAIYSNTGFWTNQNSIDAINDAGFFSGTVCDIFDYTSTTRAKVAYSRIFSADNNQTPQVTVSIRTETNAVTSLECLINSTPLFVAGSTFTLYGIKAA
jgi:hypothetical protein